MGKYYNNATTLEELRKQYKELLKKYHPDNGGSEEITKAINTEYDKLFKVLKDKHESIPGKDRCTEHADLRSLHVPEQ